MRHAETTFRAIRVENLDECHWRAVRDRKAHARFGGGPTEKCSVSTG